MSGGKWTTWLCWGLVLSTAIPAAAQQRPSGPFPARAALRGRPIVAPQPASANSHYAIMGHVPRPGLYPFATNSVLLTDLVAQAGGLTETASGNIRIIRDGRAGLQTFYTPRSTSQLEAGDLIIVDGRPADRGQATAPVIQPIGHVAAETVQIALVHLEPWPVVLSLPPEQATLFGIHEWLRQSPRALQRVAILRPGLRVQAAPSGTVQLTSGTVLVYDPQTIDRSTLPRFPGPEADRAAEVAAQTAGTPPEPLTVVTTDGNQALSPALPAPTALTDATEYRPEPAPMPTAPILVPPDANPSPTSPRNSAATTMPRLAAPLAPEPVQGAEEPLVAAPTPPRTAPRLSIPIREETNPSEAPVPPPPLEDPLEMPGRLAALPGHSRPDAHPRYDVNPISDVLPEPIPTEFGQPAARRETAVARPENSIGSIIGIAIGIFLLATVALSRFAPGELQARPAAQADSLELLIHNRLPIVEEPAVAGTKLRFYAPLAGTASETAPLPRLDRPHVADSSAVGEREHVPAPHFRVPPQGAKESTESPKPTPRTSATAASPSPAATAPAAAPLGTDPTGTGLLDRVLANVKRGRS